jgi:hypothetical protein
MTKGQVSLENYSCNKGIKPMGVGAEFYTRYYRRRMKQAKIEETLCWLITKFGVFG